MGPVDPDGLRRFTLDEFVARKGHRCATVVVDMERKRRGCPRTEVRPFFEMPGPERCAQVEAVTMGRAACGLEVRRHCPGARGLRPVPRARQVPSRGDRPGVPADAHRSGRGHQHASRP